MDTGHPCLHREGTCGNSMIHIESHKDQWEAWKPFVHRPLFWGGTEKGEVGGWGFYWDIFTIACTIALQTQAFQVETSQQKKRPDMWSSSTKPFLFWRVCVCLCTCLCTGECLKAHMLFGLSRNNDESIQVYGCRCTGHTSKPSSGCDSEPSMTLVCCRPCIGVCVSGCICNLMIIKCFSSHTHALALEDKAYSNPTHPFVSLPPPLCCLGHEALASDLCK